MRIEGIRHYARACEGRLVSISCDSSTIGRTNLEELELMMAAVWSVCRVNDLQLNEVSINFADSIRGSNSLGSYTHGKSYIHISEVRSRFRFEKDYARFVPNILFRKLRNDALEYNSSVIRVFRSQIAAHETQHLCDCLNVHPYFVALESQIIIPEHESGFEKRAYSRELHWLHALFPELIGMTTEWLGEYGWSFKNVFNELEIDGLREAFDIWKSDSKVHGETRYFIDNS